jgi:serine O-acetyltransferase
VVISAGAKVLGPFKVGNDVKIGSGSVVLKPIPDGCTVVGIPGRIVRQKNKSADELDQVDLPDPFVNELKDIRKAIRKLEKEVGVLKEENRHLKEENDENI